MCIRDSNMPSVLPGTKRSLAGVFGIMSNRNNFNQACAFQHLSDGNCNLNNAELYNQQVNRMDSNGPNTGCVGIPGFDLADLWKMIKNMIKWFIPLLILGLADILDPAYKEMKNHFYACNLDEFSWVGPEAFRGNSINVHSEVGFNFDMFGGRAPGWSPKIYMGLSLIHI